MSWKIVKTLKEVHIIPLNDLKDHGTTLTCLCKPFIRKGNIVHNSYDGREFNEKDNENLINKILI